MPKLPPHESPDIKLDTSGAALDLALTRDQRRGLFDRPGTTVVAIVELCSRTYTGHADDEEKTPTVKVRITSAEAAQDDEEAATLLNAKRAMFRRRRMDGTLDEVGNGPRSAAAVLDTQLAAYPSEDEYREHERRRAERSRTEHVR